MYQREKTGRGCKVRTKQAKHDWKGTSFTKRQRGENYAPCSSNGTRCVSNATELAKWLTTLNPSNRVAIRWRGTTFKQCVIDVTTSKVDEKHTNDTIIAQKLPT